MRLFQNSTLYPSYLPRLRALAAGRSTFADYMAVLLADRYGAQHLLAPVLDRSTEAFLANGHDEVAQRLWAAEQGIPARTGRDDILLAQIEHHRTEVFYNIDPITFPGAFARRLPSCVRARIAWRAAPWRDTDFSGYDLMVCNFPSILELFRRAGLHAAYFAPAFDPEMAPFARNEERPIDVAFVGTFSRHHSRRTELLHAVAELAPRRVVALRLETSRFTRLVEAPLLRAFVARRYRRPPAVRRAAQPPVFGRELYRLLSRSKIVVNGAIDMSGQDRGNIRCFEAMGVAALLLTDAGCYPEGMVDGRTMVTYRGPAEMAAQVERLLAEPDRLCAIAARGHELVRSRYSKSTQWAVFERLVSQAAS